MTQARPLNILVSPNSFKGSLAAPVAAQAIGRGLERSGLACLLDLMPIADGGDDTLEVLVGQAGKLEFLEVQDPLGWPIRAALGLLADGRSAVVEMARASGLKLLKDQERDPLLTTTYGTGQLIARAVELGVKRIIVGVGGSATTDGGAGCLQALGVRFFDQAGREIRPVGGNLDQIHRIDLSGLSPGLKAVKIEIACDVDNPTLGPQGAAAVFGPQKGASPQKVKILEANLTHFFTLAREVTGNDLASTPRGGAAGALAAGLAAFLGAELKSGIELVLEALGADERLKKADLAITGEGRIDATTLKGKGPAGLLVWAKRHAVPVIALAGSLGPGHEEFLNLGLSAALPICPGPMSLEEAMTQAESLIEQAAFRLGRLIGVGRGFGGIRR